MNTVVTTQKEKIDSMLQSLGIKFSARLVGPTKRDDWECDAWRVSFGSFETDYFTGTGFRKAKNHFVEPKAPTPSAADVLYCLLSDANACEQSYQDWCDDLGYDSDSIKALNTYRACEAIGAELRKVFDRETRQKFQEVLQDY